MGCYADGLSKSSLSDHAIEKDSKLEVHWNVGFKSFVGALLVEGMNFSREGGSAPFSGKIHIWILHPPFVGYLRRGSLGNKPSAAAN